MLSAVRVSGAQHNGPRMKLVKQSKNGFLYLFQKMVLYEIPGVLYY